MSIDLSKQYHPMDPIRLVEFLEHNVDNGKLSDEDFRQVIRNTLPLYQEPEKRKL